jgi:threonine dehydratase
MTKLQALRTPSIRFAGDARISLKPENLQPFGSYKIRGVISAVEQADPAELGYGLVAASAGNMAQAVAFVAQQLGIPCRIYLPDNAPEVKRQAIQRLGAELIELSFAQIWAMVSGTAPYTERGVFIHPAFSPALVQGYGTLVDEWLHDSPQMEALVIPFGVGGLALGIVRRLQQLRSTVKVYLAEPETAAPMHRSLAEGRACQVQRQPSFVDAIGTPEVLPQVFAELAPLIAGSIAVGLSEARLAVAEVYHHHRMVVEGASGCALAAAKILLRKGQARNVSCLLSGGNIDLNTWIQIVNPARMSSRECIPDPVQSVQG